MERILTSLFKALVKVTECCPTDDILVIAALQITEFIYHNKITNIHSMKNLVNRDLSHLSK